MSSPAATVAARWSWWTAVFQAAGEGAVAQADLDLPRPGMPGRNVHRAEPTVRPAAGAADHASIPVGDRTDPPRARQRAGAGSSAGDDVADGVVLGPAAAGAGRHGRVPVRRRGRPRGR